MKKYYTIGEVSKIVDLKEHVLRFWEKEFEELSPQKTNKGRRSYIDKDIQLIKVIKKLLHQHKFTIAGARKKMKQEYQKSSIEEINLIEIKCNKEKKKNDNIKLNNNHEIIKKLKEILKLL